MTRHVAGVLSFVKRLWFCLIMDEHDWRTVYVYTHQIPRSRIPEEREYAFGIVSFEPHEIQVYRCERPRCHAVGWPLVVVGEKPR